MQIQIPCELISRFSVIPKTLKQNADLNYRSFLIDINSKGEMLLIATNYTVMVAEKFGQSEMKNFQLLVNYEETLVNQCVTETAFSSSLVLDFDETSKILRASTLYGYISPYNLYIEPNQIPKFVKWRELIPNNEPKESSGNVYINADNLHMIAKSAPSGMLVFPEFIDNKQPVVIADMNSPDWVAVFAPKPKPEYPPYKKPKWITK